MSNNRIIFMLNNKSRNHFLWAVFFRMYYLDDSRFYLNEYFVSYKIYIIIIRDQLQAGCHIYERIALSSFLRAFSVLPSRGPARYSNCRKFPMEAHFWAFFWRRVWGRCGPALWIIYPELRKIGYIQNAFQKCIPLQ